MSGNAPRGHDTCKVIHVDIRRDTCKVIHADIRDQLLSRNMKQFLERLVVKAHGLVYHASLGLRVIEKKGTLGVWLRPRQSGHREGHVCAGVPCA